MDSSRWQLGSPLVTAMLGSAVVGGQYVAGKATRDALFLANFETSSLPTMIIVTAIFSIVLVVASSRALRHVAPASWVPVAFGGTALLMLAEWAIGGVRTEPGGADPVSPGLRIRPDAGVRFLADCQRAFRSHTGEERSSVRSRAPARSADCSAA